MSGQKTSLPWRRFFTSRLFLLLLLGGVSFLALSYARAYYQDYKIRQEIRALQEEVRHLENKKLESLEILQYVMSPQFVEEKARVELNMKESGEKVAIITNPSARKNEKIEEGEVNSERVLSNPQKWWYYFTR